MYPTRRLAAIVFGVALLWILPGRIGVTLALGGLAIVLALVVFDYVRLPGPREVSLKRTIPESIGLGDVFQLVYAIRSSWPWPVRAELFHSVPPGIAAAAPPDLFDLPPESEHLISIEAEGELRGRYELGDVAVQLTTPLGLLSRIVVGHMRDSMTVVPSLTNVRRFRLLAMQNRLSDAGVRALKHRGEGTSFAGLRDYVPGDDPRLLDWKSTARHGRLISREQTIERSQTVISLIDCGRAMTQMAGRFSRFEHVLSAALVLSDVAATSGDRVGEKGLDLLEHEEPAAVQ